MDHYQDYIEQVYQSFHPFNPEDGSGIVAAAPKEALLQPPVFNVQPPPTLKQIWDVQERLWLQRSLLEVIAAVNADAKDWESASIKQISRLDVATPTALDQFSAVKAVKLEQPTEIVQEGSPPPPPPDPKAAKPQDGADASSIVFTQGAGGQYRLFPVALEVLMEQDKIQDLLAALKNSPMAIDVKELQWTRPPGPVVKPVKAEAGNAANVLAQYRMNPGTIPPPGGGRGRTELLVQSYTMGMPRMGPGGAAPAAPKATGTDVRGRLQERERMERAKKEGVAGAEEEGKPEAPNPYLNVVQVTLYGQARFYTKPVDKAAPAGSPSPGAAPAPAPAAPAAGKPVPND